ncbi:ribosomal-protein-alanine N-acetyltransferase [Actinopolyspora alba]|uniref:Ribosomal-protein-alanine N-acetyltransferase n=1 Tax=Actinopolyspora alba TaxID=673379 RepID=A0A1I1U2T1_9ACTN|nr:ribosomal protein S18-alanine N-acetyltransferase [Actinopolyspora alba]SFD63928.1 ribosomal-protein-alanine N-acetyltransferase [Actinopolyspora alba]
MTENQCAGNQFPGDQRPGESGTPSGASEPFVAKLRSRDLPRCAELEELLFPDDDPWSEHAFAAALDGGDYYVGAYDAADRLIGYAGLALVARPPRAEAEVHTIAVDPDYQRKGVGRTLLRKLLVRADEQRAQVFLEVRTDNDSAIALYREHGFEVVGKRERYYRPSGADAYTMWRPERTAEQEGGAV